MTRDIETPDDLSALAWVQDELRRTLESAHKSLRRHAREAAALGDDDLDAPDPSILRQARSQLHQGVGALEMVGLPVAARVLRASEQAAARMAAEPRTVRMPAVETIERSSNALLDYLARRLADKPVSPLALFPQYAAVQELAGADRAHPADLWPVAWQDRTVPVAAGQKALAPDGDTRGRIETGALGLLKGDPAAAAQMSDAFAGLAAGATPPLATLWQLAAGCFEAQAQGLIDVDVHVQRLTARLLSQVRALAKGRQPEGGERLAQDLLFFCAQARMPQAPSAAPRLAAVRSAFGLGQQPPTGYRRSLLGRFDPSWIPQARKRVAALKDSWSAHAAEEAHLATGVTEQVALVADSLQRLFDGGGVLAAALQAATGTASPPEPELAMEVATALLYVEASLDESELDRPETAERVAHLARRIDEARQGRPAGPIQPWMEQLYRSVSDRQTIGSVVQELRASLSEVEKQVDRFLRDPVDRSVLAAVPNELSGMRGVFSVLGLDQASQAVLRMRDDVDAILARADAPLAGADPAFGRFAENLGALGFLIDMLGVHPHLAKSLFQFDAASGRFSAVMGRATAVAVPETAALPALPGLAEAPRLPEPAQASAPAAPAAEAVQAPAIAALPLPAPAAPPPARPAAPGADDDEDMRAVFFEEAHEVVAGAREALGVLATEPDSIGDLTAIRRAFHTLKGSARMVGLQPFGEAAWACEQLYNARLADAEPAADATLLAFTGEVLAYLSGWVEELEAGRVPEHEPTEVVAAAEALRTLAPQPAAPAPAAGFAPTTLEPAFEPTSVEPVLAAEDTQLVELPDAVEERFADTELTDTLEPLEAPRVGGPAAAPLPIAFDFDLDLPEPGSPLPAEEAGVPAGSAPAPSWAATTLEPIDLAAPAESPWQATAIEPVGLDEPPLPVPTVVDAGDPSWADVPTEIAGLDVDLDFDLPADPAVPADGDAWSSTAFAGTPEGSPTTPDAPVAQGDDEALPLPEVAEDGFEIDSDAETVAAPWALDPASGAAAPRAAGPFDAAAPPVSGEADEAAEAYRWIGPLRVSLPLYNIFLNEADDWSRQLCAATAQWLHEPGEPVPEDAIALAHSLAGSSATVGYTDLSMLARQLEGALARVAARGRGTIDEAALFVEAADEVRRLLHQFAAGLLRAAPADLVEALDAVGREELATPPTPAALRDDAEPAEGAGPDLALPLDGIEVSELAGEELAAGAQTAGDRVAEDVVADAPGAAGPIAAEAGVAEDHTASETAADARGAEDTGDEHVEAGPAVAEEGAADLPGADEVAAEAVGAEQVAAEQEVADEASVEDIVVEVAAFAEVAVEDVAAASEGVGEEPHAEEMAAEDVVAEAVAADEIPPAAVAEELVADGVPAEGPTAEHAAAAEVAAEPVGAEPLIAEPAAADDVGESEIAAAVPASPDAVADASEPEVVAEPAEPMPAAETPAEQPVAAAGAPPSMAEEAPEAATIASVATAAPPSGADLAAPHRAADTEAMAGEAQAAPSDAAPVVETADLALEFGAEGAAAVDEFLPLDEPVAPVTAEAPLPAVEEEPPAGDLHFAAPPQKAAAALAPLDLDELDAVDALDPQLFPIFDEEAHELVPRLADAMRAWAGDPSDRQHGLACLRALHTIKGSARLAGALRMGEMAHRLETAVELALAQGAPTPQSIDRLHAGADALAHELQRLRDDAAEPAPEIAAEPAASAAPEPAPALAAERRPEPDARPVASAFDAIDWARFLAPREALPLVEDTAPVRQAAVRVRAALLDRMVTHAGEVSITRARLQTDVEQMRAGLKDLSENLDRLRRQLRDIELQAESQISSRMEAARSAAQGFDPLELDRFTRFQELTRMMAESVGDVATVQRGLQSAIQSAEDDLAAQARLTRDLQDDLLRSRMIEFDSLSERLYRVVRQAAKESGKQVRLDIQGASIELDRGVLDRLAGPLEHLLRNAVVHGIETAERRTARGKDGTGLIEIVLRHEGNDVEVTVRDDGEGLDLARIRERAVEAGLIAPDAVVDDAELAGMIYRPGFTTAQRVTELAGRGIGMDVVRAEVSAMGGRIETATTSGQGTAFRMLVPLTTAVTQVVLVQSGDLTVAVPAALVEVVRRLPSETVAEGYRTGSLVDAGGETMPLFWLASLLDDRPPAMPPGRTQSVMIVRSAAQRVAVHLDQVVGQQEVVVKHLGRQLSRLPGLTGVSLLPSGEVVLIYNPVALAAVYGSGTLRHASGETAVTVMPQAEAQPAATQPPAPPAEPLVMVVDDSLTVRRVTQRLLQREGYRVVLAKDGLDALEKLASERPALMLSDIEMPRMDGFDLVRNVRADPALAALPVVMITSRIAQKHRDHAAQLGVNHYLGKPYSEDELMGLVRRYAPALAVS